MNNKPLSMRIQETKEKLVQVINTSSLPPCITELIIKDIFNELCMLSKEQLNEDILTYNNSLVPTVSEDEGNKK